MAERPLSILVLHPTFEDWGGAEWFIHGMLEHFVARRRARVRVLTHRWRAPWGEDPGYEVLEHGRGGYHARPADWDRIAREVRAAAAGCDAVWIHNYPATEWYARGAAGAELPPAHWYCHEPPASLWSDEAPPEIVAEGGALAALGRLAAQGRRAPERAARAIRDRLVPAPEIEELRASEAGAVSVLRTIQANSRFTAGRVRAVYGREAQVVYPISERLEDLAPSRREREKRVLWVARLAEPKRPLLMLEAWQLANERCPELRDFELRMVGDGPLRQRVEETLAAGSQGRVRLSRGVARSELVGELQSALVTVHLGLAEPLGLVPIEAMACGSAVIAHAEGGALETVARDETGWLASIESADELASLLVRVPAERERLEAMGRAGVARVAGRFSFARSERQVWESLV